MGGSKKRTHCKRGHALAGDNLRIVRHAKSGWTEQRCMTCARNRERNRPKRRHSKGGVPSLLACSMDMVRTRRLLQLDEQRERAATWWEREAILEQRRRVERGVG